MFNIRLFVKYIIVLTILYFAFNSKSIAQINQQNKKDELYESIEKLSDNQNWVETIKKCGEYQKIEPNNPMIMYITGISYRNLGDRKTALIYLNEAVKIWGDTLTAPETYGVIGECHLDINNYDSAVVFLTKAIHAGDIQAYPLRAIAYTQSNNTEDALIDFNTSENLNLLTLSFHYYWYGWTYMEKASDLLLKSDSNNKVYYGIAISKFNKALQLNKEDYHSLKHIGSCYELSGDYEMAKMYWQKSLAINPHQPDIKKHMANMPLNQVDIKKEAGTYTVPATLNDVVKLDFVFDSGASEVLISPDVLLILVRSGSVSESDFLESKNYVVADGSIVQMERVLIREIQIANKKMYNIPCAISKEFFGDMLMGQTALEKLGNYTFDYKNLKLIILD